MCPNFVKAACLPMQYFVLPFRQKRYLLHYPEAAASPCIRLWMYCPSGKKTGRLLIETEPEKARGESCDPECSERHAVRRISVRHPAHVTHCRHRVIGKRRVFPSFQRRACKFRFDFFTVDSGAAGYVCRNAVFSAAREFAARSRGGTCFYVMIPCCWFK